MSRTRNYRIDVMLNENEYLKLKSDIKRAQITQSDYIRRLILNKRLREKPDERFYEVMKQMTRIGNNLNQIARKANYIDEINAEYYKNEAKNWIEFTNQVKREFL